MPISDELCHCGRPLHYSRPDIREFIERMISEKGPMLRVHIGARAWLVPRHYIALHGLSGAEVPFLGFTEVTE